MRAASLLVLLVAATSLSAQTTEHSSKVSVPDDLIARQHIGEGDEALAQGDRPRALAEWQRILDRHATKVVQTTRAPRPVSTTDQVIPGDIFRGIHEAVLDKIRTLPDDGLAAYRELYEADARSALEVAWSEGDERALRIVGVRFFLTEAGRDARLAVLDLLLEAGRFAEARVHARVLRRDLERFELEPAGRAAAMAREALALAGLGRGAALEELAGLADAANAELAIAGETRALAGWIRSLNAELPAEDDRLASRPRLNVLEREDWTARFSRNRNETSGYAIDWVKWRPLDREPYEIRPIYPQVVDGTVYFSDGLKVQALSLFSGEAQWPAIRARQTRFSGRRNPNLQHHVTVDGNLLFASLEDRPVKRAQTSWQGFRPVESIPSRKLLAIDRGTGEVVWNHASPEDVSLADREFLSIFTVNQPPAVVGDTLYVAGTALIGVYHHWVCAIDRATGALRWRTYVGSGQQELNMFGNPIKEGMPGAIIEQDGRLYYSTNIGTLACLDAVSGRIHWLSAYEQEPIPTTDRTDTRERAPGWLPSAPAIAGNRVFFAPADSYNLYAADRETGALSRIRQATRTRRTPFRHFLGIHAGRVLVAGNVVAAFDPQTLRPAWRTIDLTVGQRGDEGVVTGRPAIIGDQLIFTTRSPTERENTTAYLVDLSNGRVRDEQTILGREREGNLIIAGDGYVIAGLSQVRAYVDHEEVARRLEQMTASGRAAPSVLMRLGDVQTYGERWGAALATYAKALAAAREAGPTERGIVRRARLALYNGWLRVARDPAAHDSADLPSDVAERFQNAREHALSSGQGVTATWELLQWAYAEDRKALVASETERMLEAGSEEWVALGSTIARLYDDLEEDTRVPAGTAALLLRAGAAERAGNYTEAVGHLARLQNEYGVVDLSEGDTARFAGGRIESLIEDHGRKVYAAQDARAKELFDRARADQDFEALRALVRTFPQSALVDDASLELARGLAAAGNRETAVLELQRWFARAGRTSPEALWQMIEIQEALEQPRTARSFLEQLLERHGDASITTDGGSRMVEPLVRQRLSQATYAGLDRTDAIAISPALRPGQRFGRTDASERLTLLSATGPTPAAARGLAILHVSGELRALAVQDGKVLWTKAATDVPSTAAWHEESLAVAIDGEIAMIDPASGEERWRRRMERGTIESFAIGHGRVHVAVSTVKASPVVELVTLDATSGDEVSRALVTGTGEEARLSVGKGIVMLEMPLANEASCFDAITGRKVSAFTLERGSPSPQLSPSDLFVTVFGASRYERNRTIVPRVVARNARTGEEIWRWTGLGPGRTAVLPVEGPHVVLNHRDRRTGTVSLVVIDTATGKSRIERTYEGDSFPVAARVVGDKLFVTLRSSVGGANRRAQRIETHDLKKGIREWTTSEFGESNLAVTAAGDWVLVLKMPLSSGRRGSGPGQNAEVYFVRAGNGRTEEFLDLGPVTGWASQVDVRVVEGGLIANVGSRVVTFVPRDG